MSGLSQQTYISHLKSVALTILELLSVVFNIPTVHSMHCMYADRQMHNLMKTPISANSFFSLGRYKNIQTEINLLVHCSGGFWTIDRPC